ncbi:MAG: hypothetical protein ACK4K2_07145 [Dehalococcoidia bacterium]
MGTASIPGALAVATPQEGQALALAMLTLLLVGLVAGLVALTTTLLTRRE